VHCFARFGIDTPDVIRLVATEGRSLFYRAYQGGDVSWEMRQPYELRQGSTLVQVGDIGLSTGGSQVLVTLPASGTYSLTLPFTYTLGSTELVTGHGRAVAQFDTTRYATDADPPFMKVLRLLQNNQPADVASGPVELRLIVSDTVDAAPAVSVAYDVGAGWVPVAVTQAGEQYTATLPTLAAGADPRLRIIVSDASGNALTHYLEPAYLVRYGPPQAGFLTSSPDWLGQAITFTNTTTGPASITYTWSFGDGLGSSQENPDHLYATPGTYTAVLTATNGAGSDVATATVVVYSAPTVSLTNSSPDWWQQAIYFTATMTTTPPGDPSVRLTWNLGDGTLQTAQETISHTYTGPGAYMVILTATNPAGSDVVTNTVTLTRLLYLPLVLKRS
jgi:PKD repeat protein